MKKRYAAACVFVIAAALFLLPLLIMLCTSLMGAEEVAVVAKANAPLRLIPYRVTLEGYFELLFASQTYLATFWNSVLIALSVTAGQAAVALIVAFVLCKIRFHFSGVLFLLYVVAALMPFQVTLLPNYILAKSLKIYNSWWALILPGVFAPCGVFLLHQFIKGVPDDMVEAAMLETSSLPRMLLSIIAPAAKPGILCVMVLAFSEAWNMVEQPLILLKDAWRYPLSLALNTLKDGGMGVLYPGAVLFMLPTVLIYFLFEDELIRGLSIRGLI